MCTLPERGTRATTRRNRPRAPRRGGAPRLSGVGQREGGRARLTSSSSSSSPSSPLPGGPKSMSPFSCFAGCSGDFSFPAKAGAASPATTGASADAAGTAGGGSVKVGGGSAEAVPSSGVDICSSPLGRRRDPRARGARASVLSTLGAPLLPFPFHFLKCSLVPNLLESANKKFQKE